jgi:hypothetical protein
MALQAHRYIIEEVPVKVMLRNKVFLMAIYNAAGIIISHIFILLIKPDHIVFLRVIDFQQLIMHDFCELGELK